MSAITKLDQKIFNVCLDILAVTRKDVEVRWTTITCPTARLEGNTLLVCEDFVAKATEFEVVTEALRIRKGAAL